MAEIFAGLVCGYALALIVTPLAALALIRMRVESAWLRRVVPVETPLLAWSFVMHTFLFITLTGIGMVFGLLLYGLQDSHPANGLGSSNGTFTAIIVATSVIAVLPLALVLPRWRLGLVTAGLVFAATFGWIMPYLSLIGPGQN